MRRLTIVEFEKNHYRAVVTLLKVVEKFYRNEYVVYLFVSDEVLENINRFLCGLSIPVSIFVFNQRKRDIFYLVRKVLFFVRLSLHGSDITYINTLEPIAKYIFFLRPRGRKVYNFHHIEYLMAKKRIARDELMFRIVRRSREFATLTDYQKGVLQGIFPDAQISVVPDGYYKADKIEDSGVERAEVVFSIPGVISVLRKDYRSVFEVFKEIDKSKYVIKLLGTFSKSEKYEETRRIVEEYVGKVNLVFFERYLTDEEMERGVVESDVILAPSVQGEYGRTKVTGAFFYVVEYGKLGVFPSVYNFPNIKEAIIYYSSQEELRDIIMKLVNDRNYLENLKEKARKEIESIFSLEKVNQNILFLK